MESLYNLVQKLNDDSIIIASESPADAAQKAAKYDQQLKFYKAAIFSISTQFEITSHITSSRTFDELVDKEALDLETRSLLSEISDSPTGETETHDILTKTMDVLRSLPGEWKELDQRRQNMIASTKEVIEAHARDENVAQAADEDWASVATLLKQQRERIQAVIRDIEVETSDVHDKQIAVELEQIETQMKSMREIQEQTRRVKQDIATWENLLCQSHGIEAGEPDAETEKTASGSIDFTRYLREEIEVVTHLYGSESIKNKDIFDIQIHPLEENGHIEITLSPRRDWLRELRKGENVPIMKHVHFVYGDDDPCPKEIAVKVDMSEVASRRLRDVQQTLGRAIDSWKAHALKSASVDLHELLSIFLTFKSSAGN